MVLCKHFDTGIDIVIDFVSGALASHVLTVATSEGGPRLNEPRLRYVQPGTMPGYEIAIRA